MTDFNIRLTADPTPARKQTRALATDLERLEREAKQFRQAIQQALATRDKGLEGQLRQVNTTLEQTARQAQISQTFLGQLGEDVNAIKVRQFNQALKETRRTSLGLRRILRQTFAGVGIVLLTRQFIAFSDALTLTSNRLRLVTEDTADLARTQERLFQIAIDTRTQFEATNTIFNRLAVSAKELGTTNEELLQFTESLNQAIRLSGATSQEANAALIQLSQGLAAGALRGEELRSVLEQLPAVADIIAKGLGVTRGELFKLGEQGAITSQVILKSFADAREEIADRFATTVPTIGESFENLRTQTIGLIGSFNEFTGTSTFLSNSILFLSDNLEGLAIAAGIAATAIGTNLALNALPAATAASLNFGRTLLRVSPQILAVAGAAGLAGQNIFNLSQQQKLLEQSADLGLDGPRGTLTQFSVLNRSIETAQRRLANLEEIQRRSQGTNQAAAREIERLRSQLEQLNAERERELSVARQRTRSASRNNAQVQLALRTLQQERQALQLTASEREVQADLLALTERLRKSQVDLQDEANAGLRAEFEALIKANQAAERQAALLERLNAPLKTYTRDLADLNELLDDGRISQEQFATEAARLQAVLDRQRTQREDPFEAQLRTLDAQINALRNRNTLSETAARIAEVEGRVRRELSEEEKRLVADRLLLLDQERDTRKAQVALETLAVQQSEKINRLRIEATTQEGALRDTLLIQNRLRAQSVELTDQQFQNLLRNLQVAQELTAQIEQQQRVEQLRRQIDLSGELAQEQQDLLALFDQQPDLFREIDQALIGVQLRALEASTTLGAGFERAFIKIRLEAGNLAAVGEDVVFAFADNATNALEQLANDGSGSFKKLANAIGQDLQRILVRLLTVRLLAATLGGPLGGGLNVAAGLGSGALNAGAQFGATVQPGQAPRPVNEDGRPEVFVPNRTGTIVPNAANVPAAPPVVNLQAVVVEDRSMVPQAIASGDATESLLVEMGNERDRFKQVLQIS